MHLLADDTLACVCYDVHSNGTSLEDVISELIRNLTLDKSGLSSTRRQLTSADDDRVSAKCLGISGLIMMVSFCSLFIINDAVTFCFYQYNRFCLFNMDDRVKHVYCWHIRMLPLYVHVYQFLLLILRCHMNRHAYACTYWHIENLRVWFLKIARSTSFTCNLLNSKWKQNQTILLVLFFFVKGCFIRVYLCVTPNNGVNEYPN